MAYKHTNKAFQSICKTFVKADLRLSEDQQMILAGAMCAWLDDAFNAGRQEVIDEFRKATIK